jgi:hypothetical protein
MGGRCWEARTGSLQVSVPGYVLESLEDNYVAFVDGCLQGVKLPFEAANGNRGDVLF